MSLRIALVGCGKIADAHVEQIRRIPSVTLVAVCDLEPIMAEQLASRYGINRWYCNIAAMLESEKPDVLHITTPPQSHLTLTRQAIAAGCHIFLEKPIAPRLCEAEAILTLAADNGRYLTVNYWPRFEVPALQLIQLYRTGVLGTVVHLESHLGYDLNGDYGAAFRRDRHHWVHRLPGRLFQNVLDHVLNKLTPFLDAGPLTIDAHAYRGVAPLQANDRDDPLDELRVLINDDKTTAYATFSAHARPLGHILRVYGTMNTAYVDFAARTVVLARAQSFPSSLGRLLPPFLTASDYARQGLHNISSFCRSRFHFFDGMHRLLSDFYEAIHTDGPPPIPYEELRQIPALMETIFERVYPEGGDE